MTLADAIRVQTAVRVQAWLFTLLVIVGGSLVVALSARIIVPLPWTPVPITGQTLGVLLVGAALGWRRGAAAVVLYLAEGAAGLPFFAAGAGGVAVLLGPTAGYLVSFPVAALVTGWLAERGWDRDMFRTAVAMALGTVVIFAIGVPWLAAFVGWDRVWLAGLMPFLPGALIKIGVAAAALPLAWRIVGRPSGNSGSR